MLRRNQALQRTLSSLRTKQVLLQLARGSKTLAFAWSKRHLKRLAELSSHDGIAAIKY